MGVLQRASSRVTTDMPQRLFDGGDEFARCILCTLVKVEPERLVDVEIGLLAKIDALRCHALRRFAVALRTLPRRPSKYALSAIGPGFDSAPAINN